MKNVSHTAKKQTFSFSLTSRGNPPICRCLSTNNIITKFLPPYHTKMAVPTTQQNEILPEALKPVAWLAGRWTTRDGRGKYPNVPDFHYHEDLEFICIGQPMLNLMSTSRHPEKQTPMHQERGFLRIKPGTNELALLVSHNMGLTSLEEGLCDPVNQEITLETVNISRMSFAKQPYVTKFRRHFKLLDPDTLEVTLLMETDSTPLTEHLKAIYKKVEVFG